MAGDVVIEPDPGAFVRVRGTCWRAVSAGRECAALEGTTRAGRYNQPGERPLYLSGSREGGAAAIGAVPVGAGRVM